MRRVLSDSATSLEPGWCACAGITVSAHTMRASIRNGLAIRPELTNKPDREDEISDVRWLDGRINKMLDVRLRPKAERTIRSPHFERASDSLDRLNEHGRTIRQYFGDALHHFGGIVARAHHSVRTQFRGVQEHEVERFGTRFFAKVGEQSDVAANKRLQPGADRPEN